MSDNGALSAIYKLLPQTGPSVLKIIKKGPGYNGSCGPQEIMLAGRSRSNGASIWSLNSLFT